MMKSNLYKLISYDICVRIQNYGDTEQNINLFDASLNGYSTEDKKPIFFSKTTDVIGFHVSYSQTLSELNNSDKRNKKLCATGFKLFSSYKIDYLKLDIKRQSDDMFHVVPIKDIIRNPLHTIDNYLEYTFKDKIPFDKSLCWIVSIPPNSHIDLFVSIIEDQDELS